MRERVGRWMRFGISVALPAIAALALCGTVFAQTGGPPLPGEPAIFKWLEGTAIGTAVHQSDWLFPVIESVHVLAIVSLVGASTLLDLRLLNWGFAREQPASEVASRLLPVMWWSFAVIFATGALMFVSEAWQCYTSVAFRIKMALLLAVGVNALIFDRGAYRNIAAWEKDAVAPFAARVAAWVSMALWVAIVFAGRGIAYW